MKGYLFNTSKWGAVLCVLLSTLSCGGGGEDNSESKPVSDTLSKISYDTLTIAAASNNLALFPHSLSSMVVSAINSLGQSEQFEASCGSLDSKINVSATRNQSGNLLAGDKIKLDFTSCLTPQLETELLDGVVSVAINEIDVDNHHLVKTLKATLSYPNLGTGTNIKISGEHELNYHFDGIEQNLNSSQLESQQFKFTAETKSFTLSKADISQKNDLINNTTTFSITAINDWSNGNTNLHYVVSTPQPLEGILGVGFDSGKLVINGAGEHRLEFDPSLTVPGSGDFRRDFDVYIKGVDIDEMIYLSNDDGFGGNAGVLPVLNSEILYHVPGRWSWSNDKMPEFHPGLVQGDGVLKNIEVDEQSNFMHPVFTEFPPEGSLTFYIKPKDIYQGAGNPPMITIRAINSNSILYATPIINQENHKVTISANPALLPGYRYEIINGSVVAEVKVAGSFNPKDIEVKLPNDKFVSAGEMITIEPQIIGLYASAHWAAHSHGNPNLWTKDIEIINKEQGKAEVILNGEAGSVATLELNVTLHNGENFKSYFSLQIAEQENDKSFIEFTEFHNIEPVTTNSLYVGHVGHYHYEADIYSGATRRFSVEGDGFSPTSKSLGFSLSDGKETENQSIYNQASLILYQGGPFYPEDTEIDLLRNCSVDRVEVNNETGLKDIGERMLEVGRYDFTIYCNQDSAYIKGFVSHFYSAKQVETSI